MPIYNGDKFKFEATDGVGVGVDSPTAKLHIAAGSSTANTAPIKLTSGTLTTEPEPGAIEYNGSWYLTNSSGTRSIIATADGFVPETREVNTTGVLSGGGDLSENRTIELNFDGGLIDDGYGTLIIDPDLEISTLTLTSFETTSGCVLGQLGVGTCSPDAKLEVRSSDEATNVKIVAANLDQSAFVALSSGVYDPYDPYSLFEPGVHWTSDVDLVFGTVSDVSDDTNCNELIRFTSAGQIGIGQDFEQVSAHLHIKAGSATAGTAPIKLTSGTLTTEPEPGALEYNGSWYITNSSGTRSIIATAEGFVPETREVNTTGVLTGGGDLSENRTIELNFDGGLIDDGYGTLIIDPDLTLSSLETASGCVTGKLGVGTCSPSTDLEVRSGADTSSVLIAASNLDRSSYVLLSSGTVSSLEPEVRWYNERDLVFGTVSGISDAFSSEQVRFTNSGKVGIGVSTPTAYLHVKAGSATAGTAPIKLTSGVLNTTPEAGAIEFASEILYFSPADGARYRLLDSSMFDEPNGIPQLNGDGALEGPIIARDSDDEGTGGGATDVPLEHELVIRDGVLAVGDNSTIGGIKVSPFIPIGTNSAQLGTHDTNTATDSVQIGASNTQGGDYSVQLGAFNSQSGYGSIQGGGQNAQTSNCSTQSGYSNNQSGNNSIQSGDQNTQSGYNSIQGGASNNQSGANSLQIGFSNTQTGSFGLQTGQRADDFGLYSAITHAAGRFAANGDAQKIELIARIQTTNDTTSELFLNGSNQRCVLQNDSTYLFEIMVVARRTDADGESAAYKLEGCIDRQTNAASTALVGSVFTTTLAEDNSSWTVTATADTTNGSLNINVTGESSKTIRWVAWIRLVKVSG